MSGRDLKSFVTNYRSAEIDKLVQRATDGLGSNKYKEVNYNKLSNLSSAKKFSSHKFSMKLEKLESFCKQNKEKNVVKQHKILWHKEFLHLNHSRKKIQNEISEHVRYNQSGICAEIYKDFVQCQNSLDSEFENFRKQTVEPIWTLREDLEYWLTEHKSSLTEGAPEALEKHEEVQDTVQSVRTQQSDIFKRLHYEQICLERELNSNELVDICPSHLESRPHISQGIPDELLQLECPDEDLRNLLLQEFINIDTKYCERLKSLDDQHLLCHNHDMCGDWYEDEHFTFLAVYDQYPTDLNNRRKLLLDMLKRHLPHKSKHDCLYHEDWWLDYKYYNERSRALMLDWIRDRKELTNKVYVIFEEAKTVQKLEEKRNENRNQQKEICDALFEKVLMWRKHKEEAQQIQAKLAEETRKELIEKQKIAAEKEKKLRGEEKLKISKFQEEKNKMKERQEELERQRLEELNKLLKEQAEYDLERVKFRETLIEEKNEEKKNQKLQQIEEERKKEERLEALRETVRVEAEYDPYRLLQKTKAWNSKLEGNEDEICIQKPIFNVHTFTSEQVTSDPRIKLEQKLREAGVHNSDYARKVLSQTKPLHAPRRDMLSTAFKD